MTSTGWKRERKKKQSWLHNWLELIIILSLRVVQHGNWNKTCFWIISALKPANGPKLLSVILTNVLTSISERSCPNFQEINNPLWPVCNRGRFTNMYGLLSSTYLTCVKSNWPISDSCSESERKYSNRTRTIARSLVSHPPTRPLLFESKSVHNPYGEPVCRLIKWLPLLNNKNLSTCVRTAFLTNILPTSSHKERSHYYQQQFIFSPMPKIFYSLSSMKNHYCTRVFHTCNDNKYQY